MTHRWLSISFVLTIVMAVSPIAGGAQSFDLSRMTLIAPTAKVGVEAHSNRTVPVAAKVWIFLSAKCPCSHSHLDKIRQIVREFTPKGIEFLAVHSNQDEDLALAADYFKSNSLGIPVFHDGGAVAADHFGALKTPHVFVENSQGEILYSGGIDDSKQAGSTEVNYLRDALREITSGKPVTRKQTRSLGCVISRKVKS